jgi:hypothetical protein
MGRENQLVHSSSQYILEIVYFWKFDSKFGFRSIEIANWNFIFNQQSQK